MTFTVSNVAQSLAGYLAPVLPGVTFYEDPNQQNSVTPCAFLQQRYSNIKLQTGGRWLRTIGLDLTYLEDYNRPDLQQRYQQAAEALDLVMETFPYLDGEKSTLLRAYDREWRIDLDALHYKFEVNIRVSKTEQDELMQQIQSYTEEVS